MSISQHIAHAMAESILPPGQCRACERKGIPILPLRQALVPDPRRPRASITDADHYVDTRLGLRTLRQGYLYVLFDRQLWHAYEVTEQGHLRRFNPVEPAPGPPGPLTQKCIGENHDIPSSFLTLDTENYREAWVAFSSDAWPSSVLDAYREGRAPSARFQVIDLTQLRTGASEFSLTPEQPWVDKHVFEYTQLQPGAFDSVHGFHTRYLRSSALNGYLRSSIAAHQLEHGVPAVILDDSVGLVQEYNHQRLAWLAARQQWREDPMRAYQLQTSQILLAMREMNRQHVEDDTGSFEPTTGDGPPTFVDPVVERQRVVEYRVQLRHDRLEKHYDEPRRAAFQAEYEGKEIEYQRLIDLNAQAYAATCKSAGFNLIEQHDYDGNDRESGIAYAKTLALCLAGGITEASSQRPNSEAPPPGSSEALWLEWLKNPSSPPYQALMIRDSALLGALLPSFSLNGPTQWGDAEKLYTALSKIIGSEDIGLRLRDSLRQAITDTLGALNAASLRLQPLLPEGTARVVMRLNCASQWLYNGLQLIEVQVPMKLSEYYALQSAHLRELQHKANTAIAHARNRMHMDLEDLQQRTQAGLPKVKPIIQEGLLSLALAHPSVADIVIRVSFWVEGTAQALHTKLYAGAQAGIDALASGMHSGLVNITVGLGTLDAGARALLQDLKITSVQASQMVKASFTGLRGVAGSWPLLLAIGGLYLMNDSLEKNLKKAQVEIGDKSAEAMLALQGARLAMLGGGIEVLGIIIRDGVGRVASQLPIGTAGNARLGSVISLGRAMVTIGSVIGATAGIYDFAASMFSAHRNAKQQNRFMSYIYILSGIFSLASVGFSIAAVFNPLFLGPLGIAITLGISAYVTAEIARKLEPTALELWAGRSYFGLSTTSRWTSPASIDIALGALNAATLGLQIDIKVENIRMDPVVKAKVGGIISVTEQHRIVYRLTLPRYEQKKSAYTWQLYVKHDNKAQTETMIAHGEYQSNDTSNPNESFAAAEHYQITQETSIDKFNQHGEEISNIHIHGTVYCAPHDYFHSSLTARLVATYWIDRNQADSYAKIITEL